MKEKLDSLLSQSSGSESVFYVFGLGFAGIVVIALFVILARMAYHMQNIKGKSAHMLIKSIIIALLPTIYLGLELFEISIDIPFSSVMIATAIVAVAVAVWNFTSFGPFGLFVMTIVQCGYAALISLGALSIVYMIVVAVIIGAFLLFGGGSGSTDSTKLPSHLRDPSTNETFYTTTGANGQPFVCRHGTDLPLHTTSYGRWMDSNGNEYV